MTHNTSNLEPLSFLVRFESFLAPSDPNMSFLSANPGGAFNVSLHGYCRATSSGEVSELQIKNNLYNICTLMLMINAICASLRSFGEFLIRFENAHH